MILYSICLDQLPEPPVTCIRIIATRNLPVRVTGEEIDGELDNIRWTAGNVLTSILVVLLSRLFGCSIAELRAVPFELRDPLKGEVSCGFKLYAPDDRGCPTTDDEVLAALIRTFLLLVLNKRDDSADIFPEACSPSADYQAEIRQAADECVAQFGGTRFSQPLWIEIGSTLLRVQGNIKQKPQEDLLPIAPVDIIGQVDVLACADRRVEFLSEDGRTRTAAYFGARAGTFRQLYERLGAGALWIVRLVPDPMRPDQLIFDRFVSKVEPTTRLLA